MATSCNNPRGISISPQAKQDIENILSYLAENWNQEAINNFLKKLNLFYSIIFINPKVFGYYDKRRNIRKYALTNQNVVYYRDRKDVVEIITVFDGRQDPKKLEKLL